MVNKDDELLAELGITIDDVKSAVDRGLVAKETKKKIRNGTWWPWTRKTSGKFKLPKEEEFSKYSNVIVAKGTKALESEMVGFTADKRRTVYNNNLHVMFRYGGVWKRGFIDIRELLPKIVEMGRMNKDYFNTFYKGKPTKDANK